MAIFLQKTKCKWSAQLNKECMKWDEMKWHHYVFAITIEVNYDVVDEKEHISSYIRWYYILQSWSESSDDSPLLHPASSATGAAFPAAGQASVAGSERPVADIILRQRDQLQAEQRAGQRQTGGNDAWVSFDGCNRLHQMISASPITPKMLH